MEKFVKGDVVVIPFPYSDLSGIKKRPALVLANFPGNDILLCQITSQRPNEALAIELESVNFMSGSLPVHSFIRPTRIFSADKSLIIRKAGNISFGLMNHVVNRIISLLKE